MYELSIDNDFIFLVLFTVSNGCRFVFSSESWSSSHNVGKYDFIISTNRYLIDFVAVEFICRRNHQEIQCY